MALNPFLMLSGIGMIAAAVTAILYWRNKTNVKIGYFAAGAGVWVLAIIVKLMLDLTITLPLQVFMVESIGIIGALVGVSIYVGLRTGLLESGLSYFTITKTWLKKMTYKEAVAFGIGFGALEAIVIGLSSFLNVMIFVLMPEIIATLPIEAQAIIIEQLSFDTLIIVPAIIERIAAILIHTFAAVLVAYSVISGKMKYLWYSVIYKTIVDGIIPILLVTMQPGTNIIDAFIIEIPFIILAIIGYKGTIWVSEKKWKKGG